MGVGFFGASDIRSNFATPQLRVVKGRNHAGRIVLRDFHRKNKLLWEIN